MHPMFLFRFFVLAGLGFCLAGAVGCSGDGDGVFDRTRVQWVEQTDTLCLQGGEGEPIAAVEMDLPFGGSGSPEVVFLGMEPASPDEDTLVEFSRGELGVRASAVSRREAGFPDGRLRLRLTYRVMDMDRAGRKPFDPGAVEIVKVLDTRVQDRSGGLTLYWEEDGAGGTPSGSVPVDG